EPAVAGELALRGTRELVLVPGTELEPGRQYRVTFTGQDLAGLPQDLPPYQFDFQVQTPQFDLQLADLESDPADDRRMIQRGVITTADAENPEVVEQMLRASYRGTALAPTWTHSGDGREHQFALADVTRQQLPENIQITLAGAPIGAQRDDERTVIVPAVWQFAVVNAQGLEDDGRKQIQVSFSDALDDGQDTRGLVRLSTGEFTTRIEGNRLIVYTAEEAAG